MLIYKTDIQRGIRCCGPDGCGEPRTLPSPGRYCVGRRCAAWEFGREALTSEADVLDQIPGFCGLTRRGEK